MFHCPKESFSKCAAPLPNGTWRERAETESCMHVDTLKIYSNIMVSHYKVTIYTCLESYISPIQALRNVILANLLSSHIWSSLLSNLSVNNIVSVIVSWGPGLYIQWHKVQAWATNSYLGITRVEL